MLLLVLLAVATLGLPGAQGTPTAALALPGFSTSQWWNEQVLWYKWQPQAQVHINAPAAENWNASLPTSLVIYALPNRNTIPWTIGASTGDWHFQIQQIGAQTRRLRELVGESWRNIITAYVMSDQQSWPAWKTARGSTAPNATASLVDDIIAKVSVPGVNIEDIVLASHSGGGSFDFSFLDNYASIPSAITRFCFLDSDYNFNNNLKHGDKFIAWLTASETHVLSIVAYDDRNITLNGQPVNCPTCGTYRHTMDIINTFNKYPAVKLQYQLNGDIMWWYGLNSQISIAVNKNPSNKILHTVLVEKNGFIHCLTGGPPLLDSVPDKFWIGPINYSKWVQKTGN